MNQKSFLSIYPQVLREWDYKKNSDLVPEDISPNSHIKAWWQCSKGHSYQAIIAHRTRRGDGCPYCSNHKVLTGYNDLATINPELLIEWDYQRNSDKPTNILFGTHKKYWWICNKNHSWEASVGERTGRDKTKCPYCCGQKVISGETDLATLFPEIAKEWNPTKNNGILPNTITAHSNKSYWWICSKNHEYKATVDKRVNGQGCPICSNHQLLKGYNDLATTNPELLIEWDFEKNDIKPDEIVPGTAKKVWWKCSVCKNSFEQRVNHRTQRKNGCPICSVKNMHPKRIETYINKNGSLADTDLINEWDYEANKNLNPSSITKNSTKIVGWKCKSCGYKWNAKVNNRYNGRNCPLCSNKVTVQGINDLQTTMPELAKEWHPTLNNDLKPTNISKGCGKKVWWICPFGHEYQATVLHRSFGKGTNCPICNSGRQTSFAEQALFFYVKNYFPDAVNRYKANWLGQMELDIYIPSIQWAIEYDGKAWHKSEKLEREIRKFELCKSQGIKLLRIREEELSSTINNTCDFAIHGEELWKSTKLNELIKFVISQFIDTITVYYQNEIDVEKDRFNILENLQRTLNKSFASEYPEIAKEWHPSKNGNLLPSMYKPKSDFKAWWLCPKCGESYVSSFSHRASGTGCPICGRKKVDEAKMKRVAQIKLQTGEKIRVFSSITEAATELKINGSNITSVCKGLRKKAGGFGWKYETSEQ